MQLVEGPVKMLLSEKGNYIEMGREEVYKKFGIYPEQVLDYLSLIGDQSDNIPGVKGIGPKTAVTLLSKYKSLDGIYENLGKLPDGQKKKLEENRENAYLSRELVSPQTGCTLRGYGGKLRAYEAQQRSGRPPLPCPGDERHREGSRGGGKDQGGSGNRGGYKAGVFPRGG